MELILGNGSCIVSVGNPLISCSEVMTCNESCLGNSQMVPIKAKLFKLKVKHSY